MTLISAYAPTMTNPDDIKDRFYEELDSLIAATPNRDKLFVLGDFNARVGQDHETWHGVIGKQGVGKCNSNGILLLRTCAVQNLLLTNTVFRLPNRNKTSWMHPRSRQWHLIDYIITRQRDRKDVRVTKAMCGAECWTDHRLIISKVNFTIKQKRRPQANPLPKRLNVGRLADKLCAEKLTNAVETKLSDFSVSGDVESDWSSFRDKVYAASLETLGTATRKKKDWFDDNDADIHTLLQEKHNLHRAFQNEPTSSSKKDAFTNIRSKVQSKLRAMKNSWLSQKAEEIQSYADRHDSRFFASLKALYGPQPSGLAPLLSADETSLITEKTKILERWAKHFESILNRPSSINDTAINQLDQVETNYEMD